MIFEPVHDKTEMARVPMLSLIRLRCLYEKALCSCLPIERIRKLRSEWADDRAAGLYDCSIIFGPVRGRIACG